MMLVSCCSMTQDAVDCMLLDIFSSIKTFSTLTKKKEESVLLPLSTEMNPKVGLFY